MTVVFNHERPTGAVKHSMFRQALSDQSADDVQSVLTAAGALLDEDLSLGEIEDFGTASAALDGAWVAATAALRGDHRAADEVMAATDLIDLLTRIRDADSVIRNADTTRRHTALNTVRSSLVKLHEVASIAELIELVPQAICALGFDRAIISRIQEAHWVPESVFVDGCPDWSEEILHAGREFPQRLGPDLFESELVRRRTGIVVTDVQRQDKVHRRIADSSLSRSYVAAPLIPGDGVIGFVHADRYFHRGDVDSFDRDMLSLFSEGVSYAFKRAMTRQRLEALRTEISQLTSGIDSALDRCDPHRHGSTEDSYPAETTAPTAGRTDPSEAAHRLAPNSPLTRREIEVLRLMANGDTNVRIANKLVVAEGTVKSHVKHILRKLGAANRADAVARWLHFQRKDSRS